jgi:hypothetical protein
MKRILLSLNCMGRFRSISKVKNFKSKINPPFTGFLYFAPDNSEITATDSGVQIRESNPL